MTAPRPFLIRNREGVTFELAGDKAGIAAYRDQYMHQGFAIVDPQPNGYERPDLSEGRPKGKPKGKAKEITPPSDAQSATTTSGNTKVVSSQTISQKEANAAVAKVNGDHEAAVKRADKD